MKTEPTSYRIRVQGQLGPEWFGGMTLTLIEIDETLLSGPIVDQAALYGILNKIRKLGLPLLAIQPDTPS